MGVVDELLLLQLELLLDLKFLAMFQLQNVMLDLEIRLGQFTLERSLTVFLSFSNAGGHVIAASVIPRAGPDSLFVGVIPPTGMLCLLSHKRRSHLTASTQRRGGRRRELKYARSRRRERGLR